MMKYEWFGYQSMAERTSPRMVRATLPKHIECELVDDPAVFRHLICVDKSKLDVISELDRIFRIGKKRDFQKYTQLEVDKREIDNYSHFFMGVTHLEPGDDVLLDWTPRSCQSPGCPWGVGIRSPIKVNAARTRKLAIGDIPIGCRPEIDLVVSSHIKELFETTGVTGLEYEPCTLMSDDEAPVTCGAAYFRAKVTQTAAHTGSYITRSNFCRKHMTVTTPIVFDREVVRDSMPDADFLTINRVIVGKHTYYYNVPPWVVTRKVLRLLLAQKTLGLRTITVRLKQVFRPLLFRE